MIFLDKRTTAVISPTNACRILTNEQARSRANARYDHTSELTYSSASEKPRSRIFGRFWPIALVVLVLLAVEVGWVAVLGYGLVFLFS